MLSLPTGWSPAKVIRRIGFTAFGVYGTEANPDFLSEVEAAVPKKNGGMILVCNIGGSLTPTGGQGAVWVNLQGFVGVQQASTVYCLPSLHCLCLHASCLTT